MKKSIGKRGLAIIMVCSMLFVSLTGFTDYNGLGTAYYQSETEIFDGAVYSEIIAGHLTNGLQRAHYVEADIESGKIIPLVFNGEVRGVYTVGDMVKYAEELGYKVLAAVNGDIYDTSTGTPKGLVIHEGNIVTSGYAPDRVVAFDKNGGAAVVPAVLNYGLSGIITVPHTVVTTSLVEVPVTEVYYETEYITLEDGTIQEQQVEKTRTVYQTQEQYGEVIEEIEEEWTPSIDFFNVPHGGANGLHLFNRHYGASTKTSGTCAEVVIECDDIQLKVNNSIKGIVKQVNTMTNNTELTSNTLVLSTVSGSASYETLCRMKVGTEVTISVSDDWNSGISNAAECVGIYYSLVENGRNVTSGTQINPRTALGIKRDGTLVLLELDGRQASVSKGLTLYDLANAMIDMGCVTAVNLDGGGSSTIYVRQPGKDASAVLKSSPSAGSERKVSNGILLVYSETANNTAARINVYPELTLAMPGAEVQLSVFASNSLYEKTEVPGNITYSVDSYYGTVSDSGEFTAGDREGKVSVTASSNGHKGETQVEITKDIIMTPSVSQITIEAGETRDIDVTASVGNNGAFVPVNSKDELFTWSCDEVIGIIDETGVFTATTSAISDVSGNIYIEYNGNTVEIPVQVGAYIVEFSDTKEHWANTYIGTLAGMKILDGIGENMFAPDDSLTRAQFVAMLAKMTDSIDVSEAVAAGFTDVYETDWYYGYVNWGYENGIVNGMGDGTFAPNSSITREQMAVMLCNYARSIGFALPQTVVGTSFSDTELISYWALDYVMTAAGAGIINGFDTGDFRPQGVATRAQAATVIYKMCEIKGMI